MSQYIMKIMGTPVGQPTAFDGLYIVDYDPTKEGGLSPLGLPIRLSSYLVCSPDPARARRFADPGAALDYWKQESGKPYPSNRPLTAYNVAIEECA